MVDSTTRSTPKTVYTGVAAADLPNNSTILTVICPDLTPGAMTGDVDKGVTTNQIALTDPSGNAISGTATTANHIVATWEGSSNQKYPPLVRKGEPVEVFKMGNQDKFYWNTTGRGRDFRTTDRLHFEIGATDPTKPGVTKDDTNTYSAHLDSDAGTFGVKTSKANGEACAFNVQGDTKGGTFVISDNSASPGNRVFLDTGTKSGTPTFQVNLVDGTTIKLQGGNLMITAPKGIFINATQRFVVNSPITVFNKSQTGAFIINATNIALNSAASTIVTAGSVFGINAVATKITGVLVAASLRISGFFKGPVGTAYTPVQVSSPESGSASTPSNTADTSVTTVITNLPV